MVVGFGVGCLEGLSVTVRRLGEGVGWRVVGLRVWGVIRGGVGRLVGLCVDGLLVGGAGNGSVGLA